MGRGAAAGERLSADFWRLWSATVVSKLGNGVNSAAGPLLAATITRDPRLISLVSVMAGLPWLFFALHTGALADRWDRRRTMVVTDIGSAAVFLFLAVMVFLNQGSLWVLCAVSFAAATVATLFDSASQAALPSIVPKTLLGVANSRIYTGIVLTGLFVGPPLGSWLFSQAHGVPFAVNAISFLASSIMVFTVRARFLATSRTGARIGTEIAEGVQWLWRHRELRALVGLLALWNLTETAYVGILVLYGLEVLQLPASSYGVLLTGVAAGGVIGALAAPRLEHRVGSGSVILGTVILTVLATTGLALTRDALVAVVLLGIVGLAGFAFNVVSASYRQSVVPDRLQGRVSSAYRFATWGVAPIGATLGGVVAAAFGVPTVFVGAAVLLAVVGLATLPALTNDRLDAPWSTDA